MPDPIVGSVETQVFVGDQAGYQVCLEAADVARLVVIQNIVQDFTALGICSLIIEKVGGSYVGAGDNLSGHLVSATLNQGNSSRATGVLLAGHQVRVRRSGAVNTLLTIRVEAI